MKRKLLTLSFLCMCGIGMAQHKETITTENAAVPTSPYSQAVRSNGFIFVAGQVGQDKNRKMAEGFEAETVQTLENIKVILEAAGATMDDVVSSTVYLKDPNNFSKMNEIYKRYFTSNFPVRTTIGVSFPGSANIEITVIAADPNFNKKGKKGKK